MLESMIIEIKEAKQDKDLGNQELEILPSDNREYCIFILDDEILLTIVKINKFNHKYWRGKYIL